MNSRLVFDMAEILDRWRGWKLSDYMCQGIIDQLGQRGWTVTVGQPFLNDLKPLVLDKEMGSSEKARKAVVAMMWKGVKFDREESW